MFFQYTTKNVYMEAKMAVFQSKIQQKEEKKLNPPKLFYVIKSFQHFFDKYVKD